ncbi:MAG: hypothetical protein C0429_09000 [Sphingopyxis sp.]|nr:hypothetical protein [Sphingopyxis sp.]
MVRILDSDAATVLKAMVGPDQPQLWDLPIDEARAALAVATAELSPQAADVDVEEVIVSSIAREIPVRIYRPRRPSSDVLALYLHGGGWSLGGFATHDIMARSLCDQSGATIVLPEYRLAPEHPFPAGLDDCAAVLDWCEAIQAPGQKLVIGGDSAGANLAAALTLLARDRGGPVIDGQMLAYPCTDICPAATYPSRKAFGDGAYFLSQRHLEWFHGMYVGGFANNEDPRLSPIQAEDVTRLPPALIVTAGFDPLVDEGEAYHRRLAAAGVESSYHCFDGAFHGFLSFAGALDAGREGLGLIAAFLRAIPTRSDG